VFAYTIWCLGAKVGNRRLPVEVSRLLSPVLVDSGGLYCHVSADVLVCKSLVARQHFNIKRLIFLGVIQ